MSALGARKTGADAGVRPYSTRYHCRMPFPLRYAQPETYRPTRRRVIVALGAGAAAGLVCWLLTINACLLFFGFGVTPAHAVIEWVCVTVIPLTAGGYGFWLAVKRPRG